MTNRVTHEICGILAGAAAVKYTPQDHENIPSEWYFIGGMLGGHIGGILPDIIDPPTSPNHRGIGHSKIGNTLGLLTIACLVNNIESWVSEKISEAEENGDTFLIAILQLLAGFIRGFIAGQTSHLILDTMTPKGLPA